MNLSLTRITGVLVASLVNLNLIYAGCPLTAGAASNPQAKDTGRQGSRAQLAHFAGSGSGAMSVFTPKGKKAGSCPLKHTSVEARVSGYVAHVKVKQLFTNPFKDKIEAVYTFPLSESAAVDDMLMKVGSRTIHGTIKKREEAREIYDKAKAQGNVASLLDQERTNIFTQSVANIMPGEQIEITLDYVDMLPYEAGSFTFAFPTVVGPRFIPGATTTGKTGTGRLADTDAVPDASRITPPVAGKGERAGHDISIEVAVDAGVPITGIESRLHEVNITKSGDERAKIALKDKETIPNKDFVLSWQVASDRLQSGYLCHKDGESGYFTLMVLPPRRVTADTVAPKEMVFLIDCSGSQSGAPLQKAKETLNYIVDHMNKNDTFQIVAFSDDVRYFANKPQAASPDMRQKARNFIARLDANGGTWMAPAVEKVCSIPADEHRLRIVTFMTDGFVGNDFEIMGMIKKLRGKSRWFPFGTGDSVNRMLIDGIAREGGGEAEYVLLNSPGAVVGKKFYDRISSPVLTDVKLDFHGLPVKEIFPHEISDVWAERPLYIKGRYLKGGEGTVTVSGFAAGKPYRQDLHVVFPEKQTDNDVLAPIWARAKVDRLMSEDWFGAQQGAVNKELKDEIIKVALDHHIMTQYTSFVAVEEKVVTTGGVARTVAVPVEIPEGVSAEATIDEEQSLAPGKLSARAYPASAPAPSLAFSGAGSGSGGGYGGNATACYGGSYGSGYGKSRLLASPQHSCMQRAVRSPNKSNAEMAPPPPPLPAARETEDLKAEPKAAKSQADRQTGAPENKLAASLRGLTGEAGKKQAASGVEIVNGKVTVKISLKDTAPETIKKLKALGAEILITENKVVTARVPLKNLEALARLDAVVLIEPSQSLH